MKFWTLQIFTIPPGRPPESSRTRAHLPVLSRRLFGVGIWIVISSFGIARLHFVDSGIGIVTLV